MCVMGAVRNWFEHYIAPYLRSRKPSSYSIEWDSERLRLNPIPADSRKIGLELMWSEVCHVAAFKRDLFTVDCIRLLFVGRSTTLEISEDDANWKELIDALPALLPGCKAMSEWWLPVALPPFSANWTVIYARSVG